MVETSKSGDYSSMYARNISKNCFKNYGFQRNNLLTKNLKKSQKKSIFFSKMFLKIFSKKYQKKKFFNFAKKLKNEGFGKMKILDFSRHKPPPCFGAILPRSGKFF